jgi:hypothetical protein
MLIVLSHMMCSAIEKLRYEVERRAEIDSEEMSWRLLIGGVTFVVECTGDNLLQDIILALI